MITVMLDESERERLVRMADRELSRLKYSEEKYDKILAECAPDDPSIPTRLASQAKRRELIAEYAQLLARLNTAQ